MAIKLGAGALAVLLLVLLLQGCLFGGGGSSPASVSRPGSIPTATLPPNLPDPILLGETQNVSRSPTTPGGGQGTYVVKSGDTLDRIADQLNVPADQKLAWIAEVLRLNGIADARLLNVGQELQLARIPGATPARATGTPASTAAARTPTPAGTSASPTPAPPTATPAQAASTPTPRPTVTGGSGTYTVVSGDYPFLIAAKLGVPDAQQTAWVNQLLALNNIDPSSLVVGQVLQLPAGTPSGGAR